MSKYSVKDNFRFYIKFWARVDKDHRVRLSPMEVAMEKLAMDLYELCGMNVPKTYIVYEDRWDPEIHANRRYYGIASQFVEGSKIARDFMDVTEVIKRDDDGKPYTEFQDRNQTFKDKQVRAGYSRRKPIHGLYENWAAKDFIGDPDQIGYAYNNILFREEEDSAETINIDAGINFLREKINPAAYHAEKYRWNGHAINAFKYNASPIAHRSNLRFQEVYGEMDDEEYIIGLSRIARIQTEQLEYLVNRIPDELFEAEDLNAEREKKGILKNLKQRQKRFKAIYREKTEPKSKAKALASRSEVYRIKVFSSEEEKRAYEQKHPKRSKTYQYIVDDKFSSLSAEQLNFNQSTILRPKTDFEFTRQRAAEGNSKPDFAIKKTKRRGVVRNQNGLEELSVDAHSVAEQQNPIKQLAGWFRNILSQPEDADDSVVVPGYVGSSSSSPSSGDSSSGDSSRSVSPVGEISLLDLPASGAASSPGEEDTNVEHKKKSKRNKAARMIERARRKKKKKKEEGGKTQLLPSEESGSSSTASSGSSSPATSEPDGLDPIQSEFDRIDALLAGDSASGSTASSSTTSSPTFSGSPSPASSVSSLPSSDEEYVESEGSSDGSDNEVEIPRQNSAKPQSPSFGQRVSDFIFARSYVGSLFYLTLGVLAVGAGVAGITTSVIYSLGLPVLIPAAVGTGVGALVTLMAGVRMIQRAIRGASRKSKPSDYQPVSVEDAKQSAAVVKGTSLQAKKEQEQQRQQEEVVVVDPDMVEDSGFGNPTSASIHLRNTSDSDDVYSRIRASYRDSLGLTRNKGFQPSHHVSIRPGITVGNGE